MVRKSIPHKRCRPCTLRLCIQPSMYKTEEGAIYESNLTFVKANTCKRLFVAFMPSTLKMFFLLRICFYYQTLEWHSALPCAGQSPRHPARRTGWNACRPAERTSPRPRDCKGRRSDRRDTTPLPAGPPVLPG